MTEVKEEILNRFVPEYRGETKWQLETYSDYELNFVKYDIRRTKK